MKGVDAGGGPDLPSFGVKRNQYITIYNFLSLTVGSVGGIDSGSIGS